MNLFQEWDSKMRFAGIAGEEYEMFLRAVPHHDRLQGLMPGLLKKFGLCRKGAKIVDLGCGCGHTTRLLWRAAPKAQIFAVDNEPRMLKKAERFLEGTGVEFLRAEAVGFVENQEAASVDAFVSGYLIHNLTRHRRKALVEAAFKALKPGGVFFIADKIVPDAEREHRRVLGWQLQRFVEVYAPLGRWDLVREWISHYLDDNEPLLLFKEAEALNILADAGFTNVKLFARQKMDILVSARKSASQ